MKSIILLLATVALAAGQTNTNYTLVTNWVATPPSFRMVEGVVYDTLSDPRWKTVRIPAGSRLVSNVSGTGPQSVTFWLAGTGAERRETFRNFDYRPADFYDGSTPVRYWPGERYGSGTTVQIKTGTRHLARDRFVRVMVVNVTGENGRRSTQYDLGQPYIGRVPVVKRIPETKKLTE